MGVYGPNKTKPGKISQCNSNFSGAHGSFTSVDLRDDEVETKL
jgi:hypothetical protein